MKQLLLLCGVGVLAFAQPAEASGRRLALAADTLAGQTLLARQLAAEACQQLAARPSPATTELSPVQAQEAFEQVLSQAIEKREVAIRQVAKRANRGRRLRTAAGLPAHSRGPAPGAHLPRGYPALRAV
jgi:hypothetical protein